MYLFQGKIPFGYGNSFAFSVHYKFLTFQLEYIERKMD